MKIINSSSIIRQKDGETLMDEQELINGAAAGNMRAFEELIIPFEKPVYNFCLRMLGDSRDAQDVSQEVFIKIYKSIKNYRSRFDGSFKCWLYRVANNACIDEMRKRKSRLKPESLDAAYETEGGDMGRQFVSPGKTPEDIAIEKERRAAIKKAISSLPADFRRMIVLREMQGLSYEEISNITGIKIGTVKSKISRARDMLREQIKKTCV